MNVINFPTPTFSHLDAGRDGPYVLFSYADKPVAAIGPFDTVEKAPRMGERVGARERVRIHPQLRAAATFDLRFWNQPFTVTVGVYADGTPGEVFVDSHKTGGDVEAIASDAARVLLSLGLQHGTPIETIRRAVTRGARGEPASIIGTIVDALDALPATGRGAA